MLPALSSMYGALEGCKTTYIYVRKQEEADTIRQGDNYYALLVDRVLHTWDALSAFDQVNKSSQAFSSPGFSRGIRVVQICALPLTFFLSAVKQGDYTHYAKQFNASRFACVQVPEELSPTTKQFFVFFAEHWEDISHVAMVTSAIALIVLGNVPYGVASGSVLIYEALESRGYVDTRICLFMETFMPLILCVNIVVTGRYYDIINLSVLARSAPKEVSDFIYYKIDTIFHAVIKGMAYMRGKAETLKGTFFSLEELEAPLLERKNLTYGQIIDILNTPQYEFEINPAHCSKQPDNGLNLPEDRNFQKLLTAFDSIDWIDEKNYQILMRKLADDQKFQQFLMKTFPDAEIQYFTRAVPNDCRRFIDTEDVFRNTMQRCFPHKHDLWKQDLLGYLKGQYDESQKEINYDSLAQFGKSSADKAILVAKSVIDTLEESYPGAKIIIEKEILISSLEKVFPGTEKRIVEEPPQEIRVCDFYMQKLAEMEGLTKQQYAQKYARGLMELVVADLSQKNRSTVENKQRKDGEIKGSKKAMAETIATYAKLVPVFETLESKDPILFVDSMVKLVVEAGGYCENGVSRTGEHLRSTFITIGLMGQALDPEAAFEMEVKQALVDIRLGLMQALYDSIYRIYPRVFRTDTHVAGDMFAVVGTGFIPQTDADRSRFGFFPLMGWEIFGFFRVEMLRKYRNRITKYLGEIRDDKVDAYFKKNFEDLLEQNIITKEQKEELEAIRHYCSDLEPFSSMTSNSLDKRFRTLMLVQLGILRPKANAA